MRTILQIIIITFFYLCCLSILNAETIETKHNNLPYSYLAIGMNTNDLQNAISEIKTFMPLGDNMNIISIWIIDQDRINFRIGQQLGINVVNGKSFGFQKINGKWTKIKEGELNDETIAPVTWPQSSHIAVGMNVDDLQKAITDTKVFMPTNEDMNIFNIWVIDKDRINVRTGQWVGFRVGSGRQFEFQRINGKWTKTKEGQWVS